MYESIIGYPRSFILGFKDVVKSDIIVIQLLNRDLDCIFRLSKVSNCLRTRKLRNKHRNITRRRFRGGMKQRLHRKGYRVPVRDIVLAMLDL